MATEPDDPTCRPDRTGLLTYLEDQTNGVKLASVDGASEIAVLFPGTHGTTVRSGVLLGVGSAVALMGSPVLSALGEVHNLANGWQTQLRRAPALILPDRERTRKLDITLASGAFA